MLRIMLLLLLLLGCQEKQPRGIHVGAAVNRGQSGPWGAFQGGTERWEVTITDARTGAYWLQTWERDPSTQRSRLLDQRFVGFAKVRK